MSHSGTYEMTIELRSDMCCGTGETNGVAVDQLCAVEDHGLPVIPGKRLKGLLREEAAIVAKNHLDSLFGRSGDERGGKLSFPDATLLGRGAIVEHMDSQTPPLTPARVTGALTTTRTGTSVREDGVADDHTLRTVQLVKRCGSDGKPTRFVCRVNAGGINDDELIALDRAVRCLRGVGIGRNRGMGEVSCSGTWHERERVQGGSGTSAGTPAGSKVTVSYRIVLESAASLASSPDGPIDHIPGSVLQGIFARNLAERDPELFQAHVLRGTRFSNAYVELARPSDGKPLSSHPVPLTLSTKKNAEGDDKAPLYDAAAPGAGQGDGRPVQRVALGGYIADSERGFLVGTPESRLSFHSSRPSSPQGRQYYSLRCLREGQAFSGTITAAPEALCAFREVVDSHGGTFTVGASGSAGYGSCHLSVGEETRRETIRLHQGDRVCIHLVSDLVFADERGNNTTDVAALARWLSSSRALGFEFDPSLDPGDGDACHAFVRTTVTGGHNAHWRLPKRQWLAFGRGSVLVVTVTSEPDGELPATAWAGLMQTEGYGELLIRRASDAAEGTYQGVSPARERRGRRREPDADELDARDSFILELALRDALEDAELSACERAAAFPITEASKSAAMRMGSLLSSATKVASKRDDLCATFGQKARENFSGEDNKALREACDRAVEGYELLMRDAAYGLLGTAQRRQVFGRYMQVYLHQIRQRYTMEGGGSHE